MFDFNPFKGIKVVSSTMATQLVGKVKRWKRKNPYQQDKIKDKRRRVPGAFYLEKENTIIAHPSIVAKLKEQTQ
jgi:hypothetical protein